MMYYMFIVIMYVIIPFGAITFWANHQFLNVSPSQAVDGNYLV